MKVEEFNTLKLIHDQIPNIKFVISQYVYECELQLYHSYTVEDVDQLDDNDIKNIVNDEWLEDHEILYINYSDLDGIHRIDDLESNIYHYEYIVIDMRN